MSKKNKNQAYIEPYFEEMHRKGKILTVISLLLFIGVPLGTCLAFGIMPDFGKVIATGAGLIAIFVPTSLAETVGEVPVMGSSYYLASLTGNILNLKLPAAINAIKVSGYKQGTKEADCLVGIAMAVSSLVTLVILALGVVLLIPLNGFLTSDVVEVAAGNVLPALFGCLVLGFLGNNVGGGVVIKGRLKAAVIPFAIMIAAYFVIPNGYYEAVEGILIVIAVLMIYFITKKLYKQKKIEVTLPEDNSPIEVEPADR